jgi:two-component system OmpR family response regulator
MRRISAALLAFALTPLTTDLDSLGSFSLRPNEERSNDRSTALVLRQAGDQAMAAAAYQPRRAARHEQHARRVLVAEDDADTAALLSDVLAGAGYAVTVVDSGLGLLGEVRRLRPSVVLLDLGLPYRSGVSLLTELKADPHTAAIPVVVISGLVDLLPPDRVPLAAVILPKPFSVAELLSALRLAAGPEPADSAWEASA